MNATLEQTLRPCVRCLSPKAFRKRAGEARQCCIIQCEECGFNATDASFDMVAQTWNGFKVWSLVDKKSEEPLSVDAQAGELRVKRRISAGAFVMLFFCAVSLILGDAFGWRIAISASLAGFAMVAGLFGCLWLLKGSFK